MQRPFLICLITRNKKLRYIFQMAVNLFLMYDFQANNLLKDNYTPSHLSVNAFK